MKRMVKGILSLMLIMFSFIAQAQSNVEMADTMRSEGKIYVVVGIILIVLVGLIAYLVMLDRKVNKLENLLTEKQSKLKA
ncbi:MAG: CcmD family protein [Chryseolinea sp.]